MSNAPLTTVEWDGHFRLIPSLYPPIDLFEGLVDPDLLEETYYIESLTNNRLRDQAGDISLVAPEDRIVGAGSSPVMAAFTHPTESRFSDGKYGVYYAGSTLKTAIAETKYHRARFLSYTREKPGEIDMRCYVGEVCKPLRDIRSADFNHLHAPEDWSPAQSFGQTQRDAMEWGILYRSVRYPGGECIAALRPPAVSIPRQGPHLSYVWDGHAITHVYHKRLID